MILQIFTKSQLAIDVEQKIYNNHSFMLHYVLDYDHYIYWAVVVGSSRTT